MSASPEQTVVVTGAAGFIGSHLVERLLAAGCRVRGVDSFTELYSDERKKANLKVAMGNPLFEFHEIDVGDHVRFPPLLEGSSLCFHLAAEAGVRSSWGSSFSRYVDRNILATQRLLDAATACDTLRRVVIASSSSVYGDATSFPTKESEATLPRSPYGVTKLASERLADAYAANWQVPTVSLRFFTVFGPRQRPDMAFHRLIEAALRGEPFPLYGSGDQIRDFTYVDDAVEALLASASTEVPDGSVFNVAGGGETTLLEAIAEIERLTRATIALDRHDVAAGDARRTGGDITAARRWLGWSPRVGVNEGLARQVAWHAQLR